MLKNIRISRCSTLQNDKNDDGYRSLPKALIAKEVRCQLNKKAQKKSIMLDANKMFLDVIDSEIWSFKESMVYENLQEGQSVQGSATINVTMPSEGKQ